MKNLLLALLFITPLFTFCQVKTVSTNEKKEIAIYTNSICQCINDLINTLNPKVIEYLQILANDGQTSAQTFLNEYLISVSEKEKVAFVASTVEMQSKAFGLDIEACDNKSNLLSKTIEEINNEDGIHFDNYINVLTENPDCKLTKMFLDISAAQ